MGKAENIDVRVEQFLALFSRERKDIRKALATILPEYNELLDMNAISFEEFALQKVAADQGMPYTDPLFSYESVLMPCPQCGETQRISRWKDGLFHCAACKKRYKANAGSISSDSKISASIWLKVLHCLFSQFTIEQTKTLCGITSNTYYALITKLFYAMSLILQNVKLYGVIEADITFVYSNYRGMDLQEKDFPEGSMFDESSYLPRAARTRGNANSYKEKNRNSVAIFTAIDDRGHCFVRCIGLGSVSAKRLADKIPRDIILDVVPQEDPFPYLKKASETVCSVPGNKTLLVSDKESAIGKYAAAANINHESHVYRKNGHQRKLSATAHDIQHVNSLHSRLKKFLRNLNGISTKYLPGYLTLFSFLECCGQSAEMIHQLFLLLSQPGLGRPPDFYKTMFVVPNIYEQWLHENNPLKRLSFSQLQAFYLYDQRKQEIDAGVADPIKVSSIEEATGFCCSSIRRIYKNLLASGYADMIRDYFTENGEVVKNPPKVRILKCFDPVLLALFDGWAVHRQLPKEQRMTFNNYLAKMGKKYQMEFKSSLISYHFNQMVKYGLRDPLPPFVKTKSPANFEQKCLDIHAEYLELQRSFRARGLPVPPSRELYAMIGETRGLSVNEVSNSICAASKIRKKYSLPP